jgi:REP element-mobilizing transposase RayT
MYHNAEFFTSTILNWQHLLADDNCKQIVVDSLEWLTKEERCNVYGFVIMPNHIHLMWQVKQPAVGVPASLTVGVPANGGEDSNGKHRVQDAFRSYTSHGFKKYLKANHSSRLEEYRVDKSDRAYQFWQRGYNVKECWTEKFFLQKLEYIHNNPCQEHWSLVKHPEMYKWSSSHFYNTGKTDYAWLRHYKD